jgi:DNA-binding GntR family transcriptional regulator
VSVPNLTVDDWRAAITEALTPQRGELGKSSSDLADVLGVPRERIKDALGKLHREGRLSVRKERRLAIDGNYRPVPVYVIKAGK